MAARTSVSYTPQSSRTSLTIRRVAAIASIIAALFVLAVTLSFSAANQLMREEPAPLMNFSSNILPSFQLVSFPSIDEQTSLSGWFFPADGEPISTVILIHDNAQNRLQFGLDMPALYELFVNQHFNVLSFDLRHSGKSEGQLSAFGYAEWEDVLAAIKYAKKFTVTKDVLLYGFGSGVSAALIAWDQLPASVAQIDKNTNKKIAALGFDRNYVKGILLDTPCVSPDNYIQAVYRHRGLISLALLQFSVPYAVRLSAGSSGQVNLATILSQVQKPVFIAYSPKDNWVGAGSIEPLVRERLRLHPETTEVYRDEEPGYVAGYLHNPDAYLAALKLYLTRFFG